MNPFNHDTRNNEIVLLDHLTEAGVNCAPFKDRFINCNTINLDRDQVIYRIFSIENFRRTMAGNQLLLVTPDQWEDPFENFLLNSQGQLADGTLVSFADIRRDFYGQCWTLRKECDGLWRNYTDDNSASVKVSTTVGQLMDQFYDLTNPFHNLSYFIGKVEYQTDAAIANYFANEIDILGLSDAVDIVETLLVKRLAYSYEQEVRIVFHKPTDPEPPIDMATVHSPWDDTNRFFMNFDPNTLFNDIEIDPWVTPTDFTAMEAEIRGMGYRGNIRRSGLYDTPFFIARIA